MRSETGGRGIAQVVDDDAAMREGLEGLFGSMALGISVPTGSRGRRFANAATVRSPLTREREVMRLVTAGKMSNEVVGAPGIGEITVKLHRGAAMRKLGAQTLGDLVRIADAMRPKG